MKRIDWQRAYRKAYLRFIRKAGSGGWFGWDWPTMKMVYPQWCKTLKYLAWKAGYDVRERVR
jgi:hypothetical protein